ncbi:PAS domain-containing protein [Methanoregula sp.]|jgi:PAS domain S-box-containing protein|uniref:PAS domain-containing protein n=1 Tax=Methanoregula sp. TaxID=2052170 RepID=UPI003C7155DA
MGSKDIPPSGYRSFSFYLLLFMVILVISIVGFQTINDYLYTKDNFDLESHNLQVQTEQNVEAAMRLSDTAANILDNSMNDRMLQGLNEVNQEYAKAGGDPARMDLDTIQKNLGEGYDIYVIDESGVIVKTTYPPELGEDFKTVPYFYSYLTKIRNSTGFFPDRVVHELLGAGQFRKYAYMPTPDHRYVLELGLGGPSFDLINQKLDNYKNIQNIVNANPYAEQYTVFNTMGRRIDNNTLPDNQTEEYLQQVINARQDLEISDPDHSRTTHFIFVDLKDETYGSDPSRIVMITYNMDLIRNALNRLIIYHLLIALLAICIGCIIAYFLSRRMTRPIQAIVKDAGIIAGGDLDHRIGTTQNSEFAVLEQSINTMVDSLKAAFQKMKDDEIFQKEMIDQLPVAIFIKRADNGQYVYWNATSERLFRIPGSKVIGKTDQDLFPPEMVSAIKKESIELFLNRSEVRNKIISNKHLDGRIIHMIIVPIFDSNGSPQYVLGISEDVSHQNINLKMDLLFSITRHDILDNLAVIASHLERAQLMNSHEEMQQFFDKTIGSIESIRNQIAYMRVLQEGGIISPKWQRVREAFEAATNLLPEHRATIGEDVGNVEIYADPLMPRVFYTLSENSARNGGNCSSGIHLSVRKDNADLLICFEDDGYWVSEADKEKIFDVGYDTGQIHGMFLIRELLGFTGITIREIGTPGVGVFFEIRVPAGKFRSVH